MASLEKIEEKKERISKAIVKIIAQQGYENATTRNIAKGAQVSHGTLHYYFKNKDEMKIWTASNSPD